MDLFILPADDSNEMNRISEELSEKKFKIIQQEENYILMKKKRYGNVLVQVVCLLLALSVFWPLLIVNVVYFTYSYLWASPNVLITTEKVSDEGEPLKFSSMDEILDKANAIL